MNEEGERGMRIRTALAATLMLIHLTFAAAETAVTVHVTPDSLTKDASLVLMQQLERALPQAAFTCTDDAAAGTLWQQVLRGSAPQLAICTAQEAARFASEGLLLPLDLEESETERMDSAVLAACTRDGQLLMAPMLARHRRMAVNRQMLEEMALGSLLDVRENPVWQPIQLYQVLEEASISGGFGMEIWPCGGEDADALLAFVQALYGGVLVQPGEGVAADNEAAVMAVEWLCEMVSGGLIGMAESREEALAHFLAGETAVFIDWTDADERAHAASKEGGVELMGMPYPSSLGIPVRDMQVTGVVAFATGDAQMDALLVRAAVMLAQDEQVGRVLGDRALFRDDTLWLASPGVSGGTDALRALMGAAIDAALMGEISPRAAMRLVQAVCGGE